jgi:hypothetical protein
VKLPPKHITIPGLIIKHPITILGSPGTLLEVKNGSIIVDFDADFDSDDEVSADLEKKMPCSARNVGAYKKPSKGKKA